MAKRVPIALSYAALFLSLFLILAGCSSSQATPIRATDLPDTVVLAKETGPAAPAVPPDAADDGSYWPTAEWQVSTPEEQGMDTERLAQMNEAIREKHLMLYSLLIIRNGYLVSETYYNSYQPEMFKDIYSCTKSVMSTLVGIAMDQGSIDSLDRRVVDFFPQGSIENLDARKEEMTLEDLLTMSAGLDWEDEDPTFAAMGRSPDWVRFVLDKPMVEAPGSRFNYCTGCSHVLSAIVQQATGMGTREFAEANLFGPLGITVDAWPTDSRGIPMGGGGLMITPREMAKLGYLYLRGGEWDGKQIVSKEWVESATRKQIDVDEKMGYGYQWWTVPSLDAYAALGRFGQTIVVVPADDLVIVTTASMGGDHEEIFPLIEEYIVPAVRESE